MNEVVKIGDSSIPVIEWRGQRVITTSQLAEVYGASEKQIKQNFNNNAKRFQEEKHYFLLKGAELKTFANQVENFDPVCKHSTSLYLWTRRGASRHCKMLGTDKAWEQFDRLEENYYNPKRQSLPHEKPKRNALSSVNMMVKNIKDVLQKAGVEPVFIAAEVARVYTDQGYEVQVPLVTDKGTMPKLYDCTEIARELGIMSKGGLPHNQAVSDIIKKLWIADDETVTTAFSRNGHEDVTVQYRPSVVESVREWLEENDYPTRIPFVDSKGNHKTRTVVYQKTVRCE